ncbi:MAG: D-amino acid dehydrogenase [Azoarcus sp.]|jgi:D-amino-acid dehydrogenase|nr:D-amino acid dehydrogenase [Azoarcus sp.]
MHVMVLGAGITGVTTAWFLHEAGFEVSVIDRQFDAGQETSFANGGQISISHPEPWANPCAPLTALSWLGRVGAPLRFVPRAHADQWQWACRFLCECLPGRSRRNTAAIAALAVYSLRKLHHVREAAGIADAYDARAAGILHLFFDPRPFARARAKVEEFARFGIEVRPCTREQCVDAEPALAAVAPRLAGGLFAPNDESGDAMRFSMALARVLADCRVQFHHGMTIEQLLVDDGRFARAMATDSAGKRYAFTADACVVCLGSHGRELLRPLGENLPIFPLKGYSVTAPVIDHARAPTVSLTDEARRIVCSRLGERLRIAGTAELNDYNRDLDQARIRAMLDWAEDRLPGAIARDQVTPWAGLRPATPGGVPIIGRSAYPNIWYNTGHGPLGWTLACGSAAALVALMRGETPVLNFPFRRG